MLPAWIALVSFVACDAFLLRAGEQLQSVEMSTQSPEHIRDIFLFAGQSNCLGMGVQTDLPAAFVEVPNSSQVWKGYGWHHDKWDWTSLPGQFGPEVSFAYELDSVYTRKKERFGIVKVAKIMTSLYNDWSQSNYQEIVGTQKLDDLKRGTLRWEPNMKSFEPWLFADLIDSAQKALKSDACASKCQVKALIWVQGESDAMDVDYAKVYEASLARLVGILRDELHAPDMKVIVAGVAPDLNIDTFPATEMMLQAQQDFVEQVGPDIATFVSASNLEKMNDHLHYNSAGQIDLGKRLANAYLSLPVD